METLKKSASAIIAGASLACGTAEAAHGAGSLARQQESRREDAVPEEHTHTDDGIPKPGEVCDQNVAAVRPAEHIPPPRPMITPIQHYEEVFPYEAVRPLNFRVRVPIEQPVGSRPFHVFRSPDDGMQGDL